MLFPMKMCYFTRVVVLQHILIFYSKSLRWRPKTCFGSYGLNISFLLHNFSAKWFWDILLLPIATKKIKKPLKKSDIILIRPKFCIWGFDILNYEVGIPPKPLITVGRIDISLKTSVWALILTFLSKIWEYAVKANFAFR